MKKTTTLLIFISIMVISLTQGCNKTNIVAPGTSVESIDTARIYESKDTVAIYLTSVKRKEGNGKPSYHLAMFDANGDWGIDTLITVFRINSIKAGSGNIQWIKTKKSGIMKITEIKSLADSTIIFKKGTYEHPHGVWNLDLPQDINIPPGETIKEKYIIIYIPADNKDTTIIIDPYLRIPD
jgi:hypothetical protein